MKDRLHEIVLQDGVTSWQVGEEIDDSVEVTHIYEVFHKSVPMYRVDYSDGRFFEIPVSSVKFVSGYMK